jgi:hypothetical protein
VNACGNGVRHRFLSRIACPESDDLFTELGEAPPRPTRRARLRTALHLNDGRREVVMFARHARADFSAKWT